MKIHSKIQMISQNDHLNPLEFGFSVGVVENSIGVIKGQHLMGGVLHVLNLRKS